MDFVKLFHAGLAVEFFVYGGDTWECRYRFWRRCRVRKCLRSQAEGYRTQRRVQQQCAVSPRKVTFSLDTLDLRPKKNLSYAGPRGVLKGLERLLERVLRLHQRRDFNGA